MTLVRSLLATSALLGALAACGSDDDDGAAPTDTSAAVDAGSGSTDTGAGAGDEGGGDDGGGDDGAGAGGGPGSAVVTLADGTVLDLEVTECETSDTDPRGYPDAGGFAVAGFDADAELSFNLARVGPIDEPYVQTGALEGPDGLDTKLIYRAQVQTMEVTVSGGSVAGSVDLRAIAPDRPYGDESSLEFDFRC